MDIRIAYETDIQQAEGLIEEFIANLSDEYKELVSPPTLIGVQDLSASEIVFRVTAETEPAMQWAFGRKFRKDLKLFLDAQGIEIPYPKMVTYQRKRGRPIMVNSKEFSMNDVAEMKKPHPCGTNAWKIIRMGADIRIKCEGCGHSV